MPQFELADASLYYALEGPTAAPVVVLSHALGTSHAMWWPQRAALSGSYRVLAYDGRGHGASSAPPGPYDIARLGRDVLELADGLRIPRFAFCGLSMGGAIGLWLAAHAPHRVERVLAANTAARFAGAAAINARIATVRQHGMAALVDGILERWFTPAFRAAQPAEVQRIRTLLLASPVEGYAANCAAVRDADLLVALPAIRATTLVIAGAADAGTTPADAAVLVDGISGARLVTLSAAHLSNIEQAGAFNTALLGLLQGR